MVNTALEKRILGRRDPRHPIAASSFTSHGSLSCPTSSTDLLIRALQDQRSQGEALRTLPFDYFVNKVRGK